MQQQTSIYFEVRNRKPTITPTRKRRGERIWWNVDGSVLNYGQIMPFHVGGRSKHFTEYLAQKQEMQKISLPAIVRQYSSIGYFSFKGKRLPIKCAVCCERVRQLGGVFLRYCPHGCGWLLSRWAISISQTRNKCFFSSSSPSSKKRWEWRNDDKKRKGFCQEESGVSITFFFCSIIGWLISLYDTQQ